MSRFRLKHKHTFLTKIVDLDILFARCHISPPHQPSCPFPQHTLPCQQHATTSRRPPRVSQLFLQPIIPPVTEGLWTAGLRDTSCPLATPDPTGPRLWRVRESRSPPTWAYTMAAASFSTTWRWKTYFLAASAHRLQQPCTCPAWKPTETPPA